MADLLSSVIAAHAGLGRRRTVRAIDVMFNFSGVLARLRGLPMVAAAGATDTIPFGSNHTNSLILAEG
jgi:hypothetical protein